LFAPAAFDFNKDGRIDVAVGEGSYSANSVHLLLNQGSNSVPKFDETNRSYLAYGDGREHLTPAIVDFNGDGEMDILAANREGKIGIYLNPGPSWKPGTDFKFKEDLKFGASPTLGGYVTITTADMNGDGLFDLLVGKANGRVALATNIGSATEPKFNAPIELKGTDIWGKTVRTPNEWVFSVGFNQGNTYATASCITEADEEKLGSPEGKSVLRVGYVPSPNKIMKVPSFIAPGDPAYLNMLDGYLIGTPSRVPGNTALLRHNVKEITVGATYTLTMKVRGSNASAVKWTFGWRGEKVLAPDKVEKGDRDAAKVTRFVAAEDGFVDGTITVGPAWTTVTKTFTVNKFKNKDLEDVTKVPGGLEIRGTLTPNTGALYIDDVQIAPKM
ncbi:MAG TPA: VCBS repeat-containing protein, partial [Chthoniobacterales bacterium]